MKKTIGNALILGALLGIAAIFLVVLVQVPQEPIEQIRRLPSIVEAQRILIDAGFNIQADGILGKETEMAWNAYDTGLTQYWK